MLVSILDVMERVDTSVEAPINFTQLGFELGLHDLREYRVEFEDIEGTLSLKAYWLLDFTDRVSTVGVRVYFYKGKAVAYSDTISEGSNEKFYWLSEGHYGAVRDYMLDVIKENIFIGPSNIIDPNETIDENPVYETSHETLCKTYAVYLGERVRIVGRFDNNDVEVEFDDGESVVVYVTELEFSLNIV